MREIIYTCDTCEKRMYSDKNLLTIGQYDGKLGIINNLPNKRIISMDGHDPIHFCSQRCFVDYFFKPENANPLPSSNI